MTDSYKVKSRTSRIGSSSAGTFTLGGLKTTSGIPGFVVSAHVVAPRNADGTFSDFAAGYDTFVGQRSAGYIFRHLLGKVFRMPSVQRDDDGTPIIRADAAFVAYPQRMKPGCQEVYTEYDQLEVREYCLDANPGDEYLERVAPLKIRGKGDAIYTVVGSKEPTDGMTIWFTGSISDAVKSGQVRGGKLLSSFDESNEFVHHAYGDRGVRGDSGSPVYAKPNQTGNTHILGILVGSFYKSEEGLEGIIFSSWSDVEEALDLKPVAAPDSPIEEDEEDEEELADLFSAFN